MIVANTADLELIILCQILIQVIDYQQVLQYPNLGI